MASAETPVLNPEVYQHLLLAEEVRPMLESAGLALRRWESFCLAFMDPGLLRGEKDRLENPSNGRSVHPDLLRKVEHIRSDIDPLLAKLRPLLPIASDGPDRAEIEELMLGFIGGSPAARSAAARWIEAPERHRDEAAHRLNAIETFVTRYHRALKESASRPPAPPAPAADPVRPYPPPAPPGLQAVPGPGRVALSWTAVPGAAGYHVLRGEPPLEPPARIATVSDARFEDAAAVPGTPYQYVVAAFNDGGEGPACEPAHATARREAPTAPANLRASADGGRIALAWEAVEGATDYLIRRRSGDAAPETVAHAAETRWTDEAAPAGVEWTYDVLAVNEGVESGPSNAATARLDSPPPAPAELKAVGGPNQVRLEWAAAPGAEGYVVSRGEDPAGPTADVARVVEPGWTDAQVRDGTTYYYSVRAAGRSGEGPAAARVSATPSSAPGVPALTGATADGEVALRWSPVPGATSYRIKRAEQREGPFHTLAVVEQTEYLDLGLENGRTYFYTVRAVGPGGKSAYSPRLRATPRLRPPAPTGLAATAGNGEITLAWRPVEKAAGYRIHRSEGPDAPFVVVGTTRHPTWVDRGARNGTPYRYKVTSVAGGAESDPAGPVQTAASSSASIPTLESLAAPELPPEALPPGVDPDKLEDLARVHKLRRVFQDTGQKFDPWEVLALMAEDRKGVRREIEQVLRLREEARTDEFTAGALALFDRILKVRSAHGAFVRKLRDYVGGLDLEGAPGPATLDIALGFLVAAPKVRQRASQWLTEPKERRPEATEFLTHAVGLAASYLGVLQRRADDEE